MDIQSYVADTNPLHTDDEVDPTMFLGPRALREYLATHPEASL